MKKILLTIYFLLSLGLLSFSAFAGEVSNFEIIGLNDSLTYLAFAEYGINNDVKPYANIFIVDIDTNRFLPNGVFQKTYSPSKSIEENGKNALYAQLLLAGSKIQQYQINPLNSARLIYILLNGEDIGNYLELTDHETNYVYKIHLNQDIRGTGSSASGAFNIILDIKDDNKTSSHIVGNNTYYRSGIAHYKIRSIYTTTRNSLIFVVEKISFDAQGESNIHYMVETITWK